MKSLNLPLGLLLLWQLLFCAHAAEPSLALPPEIEMNESAGHWGRLFVKVRVADSEDLLFLLDTGASITILDDSMRSRLGKHLQRTSIVGWHGEQPLDVHAAPPLALAGTKLSLAKVGVMDLGVPEDSNFERGILGMDFLADHCIQFDFEAREIRFLDSKRLARKNLGKEFQIILRNKRPYLRGSTFTGSNGADLLIDTGYDLDGRVETPRGETNPPPIIRLSESLWNGSNYANLALRHGDGVKALGLRFLARHLVTLDFPARKMYLKQTRATPLAATDVEAAVGFMKSLKAAGQIPGLGSHEKANLAASPHELDTLLGWKPHDPKVSRHKLMQDVETGAFRLAGPLDGEESAIRGQSPAPLR